MVFDPPQPCLTCARPSEWFAVGVSGCPPRCGARRIADVDKAAAAVQQYLDDLPALTKTRAAYAAAHPVEEQPGAKARARSREAGPGLVRGHGDLTTYQRGCRCAPCRDANRVSSAAHRARQRGKRAA